MEAYALLKLLRFTFLCSALQELHRRTIRSLESLNCRLTDGRWAAPQRLRLPAHQSHLSGFDPNLTPITSPGDYLVGVW